MAQQQQQHASTSVVDDSQHNSAETSLADQQEPESLYQLALNHIYGRSIYMKDVRRGAELLKQAAAMDHPRAMCEWGLTLRWGLYFEQIPDTELDETLIIKAAEAGDQLAIACCHSNTLGTFESDQKLSVSVLQSMDGSDPWVMFLLGWAYYWAQGVEEDYTTAAQWCQRAADAGHALGQYLLGECYQYGQGVPADYQRAFEFYKLAAEQGHADSLYHTGKCYENGRGVAKDANRAILCYRLAHAQGRDCTDALELLGVTGVIGSCSWNT